LNTIISQIILKNKNLQCLKIAGFILCIFVAIIL